MSGKEANANRHGVARLPGDLFQDVRHGLRQLRRSPGFTIIAVLTLALGIGANTAIFSFLYQIILRSLPVPNPQELVILTSPGEFKGGRQSTNNAGGADSVFSYRMFRELEKRPQGVRAIAGFRLFGANLSFDRETVDGSVMVVSGSYFPVLGVRPLMGRLISPEDDVHGDGHAVAVLSHAYWQNHLGGRPDVLNQPLRVNNHLFTIVGATPKGFTGTTLGDQPDVFVPLCFKPLITPGWDGTEHWNDYWLYLFARLEPGITRRQGGAGLNSVYAGLVEQQANETAQHWRVPSDLERFRKSSLTLVDGRQGQSSLREESGPPLLMLMASTVFVLLIAVATIANLLLARAAERKKEVAVRLALGAGRFRLVRQVLTEALILSLAGGAAGVLLGAWTAKVLAAAAAGSGNPPEDMSGQLEWPALLFAGAISTAAGLLCGLYPAWESTRTSLAGAIKDQAGQVSAGLSAPRVRKTLVCVQISISVLLLIPTGLFLKSLVNLLHIDLGLKTDNLLTFGISPALNGYKPEESRALFQRIEDRLVVLPGVESAASSVPLIAGDNWGSNLTVEGYSTDPQADTHSMYNVIGSGFFGKLGVPLVSGREFSDTDTLTAPKVAIVNERFARHFFGDVDPLGRRFGRSVGSAAQMDIQIVGVVEDSHYSSIKNEPPCVFYAPWRQDKNIGEISFYVRTALPEEQIIPQIRRIMRSLDPNLPLEDLRMFDEQILRNIRSERVVVQLSIVFSALATLLAMLGLYGVMTYSVTRRTREIGIRLALGAPQGSVGVMVMRELLLILLVGLAAGVPAALALARFAESQLFGVESFDVFVVASAVLSLTAAALIAGYLPTRRATRLDPMVALRWE